MKISGRQPSDALVKAANKVLDIKPQNKQKQEKVSQEIHLGIWYRLGYCPGYYRLNRFKRSTCGICAFCCNLGRIHDNASGIKSGSSCYGRETTRNWGGWFSLHHVVTLLLPV